MYDDEGTEMRISVTKCENGFAFRSELRQAGERQQKTKTFVALDKPALREQLFKEIDKKLEGL